MRQLLLWQQLALVGVVYLTLPSYALAESSNIQQTKFDTVNDFQIVVPVTLNGAGPFRFLLDTGSSRSMVRSKIADRLKLPQSGQSRITGLAGTQLISLARVDSVAVGTASVPDLQFTVLPKSSPIPGNLDGILSEDFLERFDVLIDYRHRTLQLESGGDSLARSLSGEHLPIQLDGIEDGEPTIGRLIARASSAELGRGDITLLLDSGANNFMWLRGSGSLGPAQQTACSVDGASGFTSSQIYSRFIRQLRLGNKLISNLTVFAPPVKGSADTDALLPTSLFNSMFISHAQKYVILEPSQKQ